MSVPSGEIATAGKSGRSDAAAALTGALQVSPRLVDHWTNACSFGPGLVVDGVGPSHQPNTMTSLWGWAKPVGFPLAMSAVGPMFVRAPAMPSNVRRLWTGSKSPHSVVRATGRGR